MDEGLLPDVAVKRTAPHTTHTDELIKRTSGAACQVRADNSAASAAVEPPARRGAICGPGCLCEGHGRLIPGEGCAKHGHAHWTKHGHAHWSRLRRLGRSAVCGSACEML